MSNGPDDALHTPEMDFADRELDARIDYALGKAREAEAHLERVVEKLGSEPQQPTDEEVARIKNFVLGHARTEEWEPVIEKINRGETTWREVVEGLANGGLSTDVARAFDSLSKVPPASMEELVAAGVIPADEPDAEDPTETSDAEADDAAEEHQVSDRFGAMQDDDDDYFDDFPSRWGG